MKASLAPHSDNLIVEIAKSRHKKEERSAAHTKNQSTMKVG